MLTKCDGNTCTHTVKSTPSRSVGNTMRIAMNIAEGTSINEEIGLMAATKSDIATSSFENRKTMRANKSTL